MSFGTLDTKQVKAAFKMQTEERVAAYYQSTTAATKSAAGGCAVPREAREPCKPANGGRRSVDRPTREGGDRLRDRLGSVVAATGLAQALCPGGRRTSWLSAVQASTRSTTSSTPAGSRHHSLVTSTPQGSPGPLELPGPPPPLPSEAHLAHLAHLAASYMDEDVISVTGLEKAQARDGRESGDPELAELSRIGEESVVLSTQSAVGKGTPSRPMGKRSIANARANEASMLGQFSMLGETPEDDRTSP